MTMRALLAALLTGMALFSVSPLAQAEPTPATTCTDTVVDETCLLYTSDAADDVYQV